VKLFRQVVKQNTATVSREKWPPLSKNRSYGLTITVENILKLLKWLDFSLLQFINFWLFTGCDKVFKLSPVMEDNKWLAIKEIGYFVD